MRPKRERGVGRNPGSLFLAFFDAFEYNGDTKKSRRRFKIPMLKFLQRGLKK
jgi:hypothetical protein